MNNSQKVMEFHDKFDVARFRGRYAELLSLIAKRHKLLEEEFLEGQNALFAALLNADSMTDKSFTEMVDAYLDSMADILYVVYGTLDLLNVDANELFDEIHNSNMSKLDSDGHPIKDAVTGKIKKGPNYEPPQLDAFVFDVMNNVTNRVD